MNWHQVSVNCPAYLRLICGRLNKDSAAQCLETYFHAAGLQTLAVDFVLKRYSKAFLISFHSRSLNIEPASEESRGSHRHWQACATEGTWPYLFISPAQWSQYLARDLLQKRTTKARTPYPRLIHSRLIKKRIT